MLPKPEKRKVAAPWRNYLLALAAVAAALALRYLMNPILGQQGPYLILTLAIVLAALYGGFGPALFATALGTLIGTYLFIGHAAGYRDLLAPANIGRTGLFVAIGLSISVIGGRLRASRHALAESVRQLRASNRAKDHAMAMLGHEIRNPLSALRSSHEILKRSPDNPERVIWASELIQRQVLQMTRMADDLMDLSSVMRSEVAIEKRRVDLRLVLEQALEQAGPLVARKAHRLHTDLGTETVVVVGDATRLVQVFANLLNNAAKYTDAGGELTLSLRPTPPRSVVVSVRDSGAGMEPDAIPELFEPFVQAPAAAANAEGGLGLGLAIVKRIVEMHGGQVDAQSVGLGHGSTFFVTLPLAAANI